MKCGAKKPRVPKNGAANAQIKRGPRERSCGRGHAGKWAPVPPEGCRWREAAMRTKTPPPVKQPRPKPKKTPVPDDKRLISFRIAHAVADPDARPPPRSPQAVSPKTRRSPSASPARLPISASSESKAARRGAVPPSPPPLPPVRFPRPTAPSESARRGDEIFCPSV